MNQTLLRAEKALSALIDSSMRQNMVAYMSRQHIATMTKMTASLFGAQEQPCLAGSYPFHAMDQANVWE